MSRFARARADAAAAEAACELARLDARGAVDRLAAELRRAATPGRIVVGGLGLGFFAGRAGPGAAKSMRFAAGPIFQLLSSTLLPALMAGFAAAQAVDEEADADAAGEQTGDEAGEEAGVGEAAVPADDAASEAPDPEETDDGPPPPSRRRRRRR